MRQLLKDHDFVSFLRRRGVTILMSVGFFLLVGFIYQQSNASISKINENSNRNSRQLTDLIKRVEEQGKRNELALKESRIQSRSIDCLVNFIVREQRRPTIRDVEVCRRNARHQTETEPFFNSPSPRSSVGSRPNNPPENPGEPDSLLPLGIPLLDLINLQ